MSNETQKLGQRIAAVEEQLARLLRSGVGLGHSSFDDGQLNQYTNGQLGGSYGTQYDGSNGAFALSGATPPTPRWTDKYGPMCEGVIGGLRIRWEGYFEPNDLVVATMDHKEVEVHVSDHADLDGITFDDLKTTITSARGGEVLIPMPVNSTGYYLRLRARTTAGKASIPSTVIGPFYPQKVLEEDLGFDLSTVGGSTIFWGAAAPTTDSTGDLWLKTDTDEAYRWSGATDGWQLTAGQDAVVAALHAFITDTTIAATPTGSQGLTSGDTVNTIAAGKVLTGSSIQPNSLVASDVVVTGTVTGALLDVIIVLATTIIAGDPAADHAKLDNTGIRAYITDDDGIPNEIGWFGHGMGVIDPDTGLVVGGINEDGVISGSDLNILDDDPTFGGTPLSARLWNQSWGLAAYGKYPAIGGNSATTNTEAAFMELAFTAKEGRAYTIFVEGIEPIALTAPGAWQLRIRYTSDGTTPTTSSPIIRTFPHANTVDSTWNNAFPFMALHNGNDLGYGDRYDRLLFNFAAGSGSQGVGINRVKDIYIWVMDVGPKIQETGDVLAVTSSGGATTKTNYVYEAAASWQRTWNQAGAVISDTEMQQGYGDSFNGIRSAVAGWVGIPGAVATATVTKMEIYMVSYWWWNTSGGILHMGEFSGDTVVPATWPGQAAPFDTTFTARNQGRWITCPSSWVAALQSGGFRGISITAPSTSAAYYGKFYGANYSRPRVRISYTV